MIRPLLSASIALLLLSAGVARADSMYAIRDLGADVTGLHLNAAGQVAGTNPSGGFVDSNGQVTSLGPYIQPVHIAANGNVINAAGAAYGTEFDAGYNDFRPATAGNDSGQLIGIDIHRNMDGDIDGRFGYLYTPNRPEQYGGPNGRNEPLPYWYSTNAAYPNEAYPNAINNQGVVAGGYIAHSTQVVDGKTQDVWTTNAFRGSEDLSKLVGGTWSMAFAINQKGDVYGTSNAIGSFLIKGETVIPLPALTASEAAMNNADQVVGQKNVATNYGDPVNDHATFFDPAKGVLQDLNTLIPNSGWVLTDAVDINDNGQIVGYGMLDGVEHGYLLTPEPTAVPAPEPSTLAAIGLGIAGWAASRRRKRSPMA